MKRKRETPTWRKWLYCLLPALAAVTLYLLLPLFPRFTEYVWVRGVFRIVSFPLTGLMSLFPFSVTEVVVVAGIPALLALAVVFVVRLVRRADRRRVAERGARFVAFCLSLFLLLFMVMDGGNFSRLPTATLFGLTEKTYDAAFLQAVTADLAAKTNAARANVAEDADGYMTLSASKSATLRAADDCYKPLRERYPFLVSGVWRVKSVALSHLWSYTGYTGVYCPWLSEVSINTDTPVSEWGHTAAHEIAHTMGFAREDACNFVAYLACVSSDNPDFVYSGYLAAFTYCANALYDYDKDAFRTVFLSLSDGVCRDLKQRSSYWKQFSGQVMDSAQSFNDAFIKANGVESGIISYNEAVSLILQYYDTNKILA